MDYTHFCPYCGARYLQPPEKGRCACCGGPGIQSITKAPIETAPSHTVPADPVRPDPRVQYYLPVTYHPVRRVQYYAYRTFGFRWVTAGIVTLIAVFLVWQIYLAFFTGVAKPYKNPSIQQVQSTREFVEPTKEFASFRFFSARESEALRSRENVINVAVIGGGFGVRYMVDNAVVLNTSEWKQVDQVFGITGLTNTGTSVTMTIDTASYTVNVLQGFLLADRLGKIYVVDMSGKIWEHNFTDAVLVPVSDAVEALKAPVPLNSTLSLTLK